MLEEIRYTLRRDLDLVYKYEADQKLFQKAKYECRYVKLIYVNLSNFFTSIAMKQLDPKKW